jgi:peptidoglycan/xylan/chitin deacetylase (PgdA/CDA1 family)
MMRAALRWLRANAFESIGANRRRRDRLDGSCAAVLMYHRVLPQDRVSREQVEPGMFVTPETFSRHLCWLAEEFSVLPVHEILGRQARGDSLPPRACAISFDDGWRDNLEHALPALERHGLPATIFVVTERVGSEGAFWPDEVCRRMAPLPLDRQRGLARSLGADVRGDPVACMLAHLKRVSEAARGDLLDSLRGQTAAPASSGRELLDWDDLARLADARIDIESHGASHAILTGLPDEAVERELRTAREQLLERGHGRHGLLAYPSGRYDERVRAIADRLGHAGAFTTEPGLLSARSERLALPRIGLHEDISGSRAEFLYRFPGFV